MGLTFLQILLGITAVSTALMGGLFYAYSCSVNPGLGRLSDIGYLSAMQSINRAILNPVFFASFLGSLALLPVCTWAYFSYSVSPGSWCVLGATFVYFIGVLGVTMAGNVPLNNALDKADLTATSAGQLAEQRAAFEERWNRLNMVRTVAAVGTVALMVAGCIGLR
ncbi:putative membrane protein [Chitinophaga sp. W3I9]|uniref:anthrone oxygenase family protein n=1 Tax=Chitinophaga sp. W3I9 TaxID=3373924 RepID=UPI003D2497D2